ncbi:MAG TPA: flavoprotein, partial [Xanthobacteraceae bacterium]|nr:flavoprotein [Xanthobacteraceae bacterium]
MASITIRQLDEDLKQRLRLRAARNGRSMEDEARTILGAAAALERQDESTVRPGAAPAAAEWTQPRPVPAPGAKRILLIISGGIAAYKSLDLIRRLKERGLAVRCILTAAAQEF